MTSNSALKIYVEALFDGDVDTCESIARKFSPHDAMMIDEVVAADALVMFYRSLDTGATLKFAHMCALQQAPKCMTDREFFHGVGDLGKQFEGSDQDLALRLKVAKQHGYKPSRNDFYNPALARFPGDPEAFIPSTGGRGHVQKVLESRGQSAEGAVNVKGREAPPPQPKRLGDDIALAAAKKMAAENPELRRKSKRELISMAVEKHGAKKNSIKTPESYKQG